MVPEKGAHKDELDERLIEARDEVLLEGESVVAVEPGDQGQAVVLTDSRLIILKAGITATGMLNGRRTGVYPLGQITNVSVRKGPMGAVLQIMGNAVAASEEHPESIVVFSGPDKVKHCEAIAVKIEAALGRPVERIEPKSEAGAPPAPESAAEPEPGPEPVSEPAVAKAVEAKPKSRSRSKSVAKAPESAPAAEAPAEPEQPKERKPRGRRVAKSLAEEMFEESVPAPMPPAMPAAESVPAPTPDPAPVPEPVMQMPKVAPPPAVAEPALEVKASVPEPAPVHAPAPEPVPVVVAEAAPAPVVEPEPEPEPEPVPGFRPNPNLPKPTRRKSRGPNGLLVLTGALMAMVLIGMAITAPLRQPQTKPAVEINVKKLTNSASVLRRQYIAVSGYRAQAMARMKESDRATAAVRAAIASHNHQAIVAALDSDACDAAWTKLSEVKVPMGLAGAQENLVSGLFIRKSAMEGAVTGSVSSAETLRKLTEADQRIAKGTAVVDQMLRDLESRMPAKTGKRK